jgi:enoyl-CoA hydratase/carnithine racemase
MAILVARRGPVALLTLQRPERLNAVNEAMYNGLLDAFAEIERDSAVRAVVMTGAGRAFCVGADLKGHAEASRDEAARVHYVQLGQRVARAVMECRCPVVGAIQGHAIGAGLELALACDLALVANTAKLRFPEFGLGTFVGGGVTWTLPRRVGLTRARELLLLGRFFLGEEAARWGLLNEAVPAEVVLERALAWAGELAKQAPLSLAAGKRALRMAAEGSLADALAAETAALLSCMGTRDWQEGIAAFAAKREPEYRGE